MAVHHLCFIGMMSKEPITASNQAKCWGPEKCFQGELSRGWEQAQGQRVDSVGIPLPPPQSLGKTTTLNHEEMSQGACKQTYP